MSLLTKLNDELYECNLPEAAKLLGKSVCISVEDGKGIIAPCLIVATVDAILYDSENCTVLTLSYRPSEPCMYRLQEVYFGLDRIPRVSFYGPLDDPEESPEYLHLDCTITLIE